MRGGPEGNERLTAASGAVLFLLLAAEGVTILFIRPLLSTHVFIGMLLIPPVAAEAREHRLAVRPLLPRLARVRREGAAAPAAPAARARRRRSRRVVVFATGVALLIRGPGQGLLVGLHKASFVVWLVATGIHVLAYMRARAAARDRGLAARAGRASTVAPVRTMLLAGAIVAGAVLALATIRYAHPWVLWQTAFHGHDG